MTKRVAIIGAGSTTYRSITPDVSYRELIFEAATKAYKDAGVKHTEIESFVTAAEDFMEGYSIADEYTPDQLGAVHKPMQTIPGDAIYALATAHMMIASGLFKTVVVESHSKASHVANVDKVTSFALDPILNRPLKASPQFVAGLEMQRYLHDTKATEEDCAAVAVWNKMSAMKNNLAGYSADITINDVMKSEAVSTPLKRLDMSDHADGCIVFVLAEEETAKRLSKTPIWINGLGWCSDSVSLESRTWGEAAYAKLAAERAYKMAGITNPSKEIDLAEICDEYTYKQLQHIEALNFCKEGEATKWWKSGSVPINTSGGSLGMGHLFEAAGAAKVFELVTQLRGNAGERQVSGAKTGLAQCWRGVPTNSGAVIILGS